MPIKFPFLLSLIFSQCLLSIVEAQACTPWKDSFESHQGLTVGSINVKNGNIFDLSKKKESTIIHEWANRLHIKTKESVIARQLLFKQADKFSLSKLNESERLIRANRYIKDTSITPIELCGNKVNINVFVKDKWTLTPGVSFGHSGGKSKSGIEIEEHNLFGLGKNLSLSYNKNSERNSTLLAYTDPQLFGSRKRLYMRLQDNSDGKVYELDLSLPFYAFDSKRSWGVKTTNIKQKSVLYGKGIASKKIKHEQNSHAVFWGWSNGRIDNYVARFKVGWNYKKETFDSGTASSLHSLSNIESYPWFQYEATHDKFIKKTNFRTMGQIEDVSLGKNLSIGVGLLNKSFGSTDNYLRLSGSFAKGYEFDNKNLIFIEANASSYLGKGLLSGEAVSLIGEWVSFDDSGNDLYFSTRINGQSNLLPNEQILLGGDTGLRGYPKAYQAGSKSVLFTAERRFHFDWYPLGIAKFGGVIFADAGTAWSKNEPPKLLANAGIGLRIIPTRSSSNKSVHLDLAFPLMDRENVDSFQFIIRTKTSF